MTSLCSVAIKKLILWRTILPDYTISKTEWACCKFSRIKKPALSATRRMKIRDLSLKRRPI